VPSRQAKETGGRRRRLRAAARRETIVATALPIFATAGYKLARVSDIADRVGVTEPVIFRNFRSKAELFAAVLQRASDDLAGRLAALTEEGDDMFELVCRLLSAEHLDREHQSGGFGVLFTEAETARPEGTGIPEAAYQARARVVEALAGLLRRGQLDGTIRDDVSPTTLSWSLLALIHAREFGRAKAGEAFPAVDRELLAAMREMVQPRT
jgi:AcrR family transcriptional regulator